MAALNALHIPGWKLVISRMNVKGRRTALHRNTITNETEKRVILSIIFLFYERCVNI